MVSTFIWDEINNLIEVLHSFNILLDQSKIGIQLIKQMIESIPQTEIFYYNLNSLYVNYFISSNNDFFYEKFLDNNYWFKNIQTNSPFFYNNHFVWTSNVSLPRYNLGYTTYWINLYPWNYLNYIKSNENWFFWLVSDQTLFKIKFVGYQFLDYQINYLSPNYLKHWDYAWPAYISTSINLNPRFIEKYLDTNGIFLIWYEHFYNLDTFLKYAYAYWSQIALVDANYFDIDIQNGINIWKYDSPYQLRYWWLRANIKDEYINQVDDITKIDFKLIYGPHYDMHQIVLLNKNKT